MALPIRLNQKTTQENPSSTLIPSVSKDKQGYINAWSIYDKQLAKATKGTVEETYAVCSEMLRVAPSDFFDKYTKIVEEITFFVQNKLAQSDKASLIADLKKNPTDSELKARSFSSINAKIVEYESFNPNSAYTQLENKEKKVCVALVFNEICGLGALEPLFRDTDIREIICNGAYDIQIEIGGKLFRVPSCKFRDAEHLQELINKLFTSVNKEITKMNPADKARLHDNSRVFAVHNSVAPSGPSLNIRRHTDDWISPDVQINRFQSGSQELFDWLGQHIHAGLSFIVNGGTGTGKALTVNTKIPTPSGFVRMGDIKVNDTVFDSKGHKTKVLAIYKQLRKDVYRVHFSNNKYLDCDLEHNWLVALNDNKFEYTVKTTQELLDYGVRTKQGHRNFIVPQNSKVEYPSKSISIHPYLLGLILGFGVNKHTLRMTVKQYSYFKILLGNTLGDLVEHFEGNFVTIKHQNSKIKNQLEKYNMINGDILIKTIPNQYKINSESVRKELIQGIIDSIGYVNKNSWKLEGNLEFLKDTEEVLLSLGYKASIYSNNKVNRLSIATNDVISSIPYKRKVFQKFGNHKINRTKHIYISKIEKLPYKEKMQCITVDSPTHTFLAGDYIVTHNTTALASLCGYLPNDKRILIIEKNLEIKLPKTKMIGTPMETIGRKTTSSSNFEVTMRNLGEYTTQMRPDIIICGEVVGAEAYDLTQLGNTGHQVATSIHSNNSEDVLPRLTSLISQTELVKGADILSLIAAGIDLVVSLGRFYQDGSRKIINVSEVSDKVSIDPNTGQPTLEIRTIWEFVADTSQTGKVTGKWVQVNELSDAKKHKYGIGTYNKLLTSEELKSLYRE